MDPFPVADPRSSSRFTSPSSKEGRHELDFIPFAKTSKTFIRRPGNLTTIPTTTASGSLGGRWSPISNDDANVPGRIDAPLQNHDDLVLVPEENDGGHGGECEGLHGNWFGGTTDFPPSSQWLEVEYEAPAEIAHSTLLQSNSRLRHQHQLQQPSAEFLLEIPTPKLINRRKRKLRGSSSLNEKYSHMKYEMELLSQDPVSQSKSSPYSSRSQFQGLHPSFHIGVGYESVVPDTVGVSSNWTSTALPSDETYIDPGMETWEQNPGVNCSLISAVTRCNKNITNGGPYSTPHFRLSSSSAAMGHVPRRPLLSVSGSIPLPHSNVLLPLESVATQVDPIVPGTGKQPEATLNEYQFDGNFELEEFATDERSAEVPTTGLSDHSNISPRSSPFGDSVLNQRPLTLRDRIHKLGQEMRTSAATSFSRFPSPTHSPPGSPSVSTSFSRVLKSTLFHSSNHGKDVKVKDKPRSVGREEIVKIAAAKEEAQANVHKERLTLQQQRQQRRFQSSVKSDASWTGPPRRLDVLDSPSLRKDCH